MNDIKYICRYYSLTYYIYTHSNKNTINKYSVWLSKGILFSESWTYNHIEQHLNDMMEYVFIHGEYNNYVISRSTENG